MFDKNFDKLLLKLFALIFKPFRAIIQNAVQKYVFFFD